MKFTIDVTNKEVTLLESLCFKELKTVLKFLGPDWRTWRLKAGIGEITYVYPWQQTPNPWITYVTPLTGGYPATSTQFMINTTMENLNEFTTGLQDILKDIGTGANSGPGEDTNNDNLENNLK